MKLGLLALFFLTAVLYASVGFGGGSTYNALLFMADTDTALMPLIALACNVVVVSGNVFRYWQAGVLQFQRYLPLVALSVPMAWLGGSLPISQQWFIGLLAAALLFSGGRLLWSSNRESQSGNDKATVTLDSKSNLGGWAGAVLIGGVVGFYAGLVGIGGGIFLAPILHFTRWGSVQSIAAACSCFILVNSLAGMLGQYSKLSDQGQWEAAWQYWPLLLAVACGGWLGNYLGVFKIPEVWIKRFTAVLILYVAVRMSIRWLCLINIL